MSNTITRKKLIRVNKNGLIIMATYKTGVLEESIQNTAEKLTKEQLADIIMDYINEHKLDYDSFFSDGNKKFVEWRIKKWYDDSNT